MRITSGILKNRRLKTLEAEFRPTKESVREAVFSSLGGSCDGLHVLDLYAGTGSLGLEAWSRGAKHVSFVEKQKILIDQLYQNIQVMRNDSLGTTDVIFADVCAWLKKNITSYDIIFADPPYNEEDTFINTLDAIEQNSSLSSTGCVVYELRYTQNIPLVKSWNIIKEKRYGKTKILMLKRI